MHVNIKTLWKKIYSFLRAVRQGIFFLAFVGVALVAYLYFYGLPSAWKQAVLEELGRRGVHLQIESLHLDPLRGVVARGVKYTPSNEQISVHIGEISLNVNVISMLRKRFTLDEVEVDGSDIQLYPKNWGDSVTIQRATGNIRFAKDGVVYLESVVGNLSMLRLEINGRLDLSIPSTPSPHMESQVRPKVMQEIISKLKLLKAAEPVLVELRVDGRVAEPETLRMKVQIRGKSIAYDGCRADLLVAQINYVDRVLSVPVLSIKAGGGKANLDGSYDVSSSIFRFELSSDLVPNALFSETSNLRKSHFLLEARFRMRPEVWIKGEVDLSAENKWQTLKGDVVFRLREVLWRNNLIRELQGNGKINQGYMEIPHLKLVQDFGQVEGDFRYEFAAQTLTFDFNSTLDIANVMKILYPSQKNWFHQVRYVNPPFLHLTGKWAVRDPNGLHAKGNLEWQNWSSREVPVVSTRAHVKIDGRKFQFDNLELTRNEGQIKGDLMLDFSSQTTTLDIISTVHFSELARFIGQKTEELFRPYQFPTPPTIQLKGNINLDNDALNDLWAHVESEKFQIWKLSASHVTADIRSHRKCLEIAQFSSDFYDGRLEGDAIWDLSTPNQDWAFRCHVEEADFDRFTHDLWQYEQVEGKMTGWAEMSGIMKNSRETLGRGEVKVADGVLWRIPLFGEFSKLILFKYIPIIGEQRATRGTATFKVADEKVWVDDMKIRAGLTSLTAKGTYKFDQSLDFIVQAHFFRDLIFGWFLYPITKPFEYHLGGTLTARKWKPRFIPKELLLQFGDDDIPKEDRKESEDVPNT